MPDEALLIKESKIGEVGRRKNNFSFSRFKRLVSETRAQR
jgi:hypothetical protein